MTKKEIGAIVGGYYSWNRNGRGYDLYKAYGRCSDRKKRIWASLSWLYSDLRVTSHNCNFFSCAGFDKDGKFTVITPSHRYSVSREELNALLGNC